MNPRLSKTRFLAGRQCELRLWNDVYCRGLATPWGETQQAIFDRGTRIGELARARYPGGVLVGHEPWEREAAVAETHALMNDASVPAIYEAALEHEGLYVRVDVMMRNGSAWDLIEVKASTRPEKEVFLNDIAVQYWTALGTGLTVSRAGVLVLNRGYIHGGGDYDLQRLFVFGDATEFCIRARSEVEADVQRFHTMLQANEAPAIPVGEHCFSPYECPYYAHCSAGLKQPEYPVTSLHRLHHSRREALERNGIDEIAEIPDDFPLTAIQARMRNAVLEGQPWISPALPEALASLESPAHFLDFEAFVPALPPYPGTRPFDVIPFMYSVHRRDAAGELAHLEYLHEPNSDPRRAVAERLIEDLGETGSIVVYSFYERQVLNHLAAAFPGLAEPLQALIDRLWDLLPVVRHHYYHLKFHGSFSIKSVLPVLDPESGWSELDIADGMTASMAYENALETEDAEQRTAIFDQLRAYCRQDTLAMVRLYDALQRITEGNGERYI